MSLVICRQFGGFNNNDEFVIGVDQSQWQECVVTDVTMLLGRSQALALVAASPFYNPTKGLPLRLSGWVLGARDMRCPC